jgi:hypothetical protein
LLNFKQFLKRTRANHIEGLTSPGAYYPRFDEIALDTNTRTGKSYRVFLHEVVHAATEYVLNTYGTNPQEFNSGPT